MNEKVKNMFSSRSFKATYYAPAHSDGTVLIYRKGTNGKFHRAIKVQKKDLINLVQQIREEEEKCSESQSEAPVSP